MDKQRYYYEEFISHCDLNGFLGCLMKEENKKSFTKIASQYSKEFANENLGNSRKSIPKVIHQIWIGKKPIPENCRKFMRQWQSMYPDWEYILWDDHKVNELKLSTGSLIDASSCYGFKSDILKAEILNQFGGVYIDVDYEPIKSIVSIHDRFDFYGTLRSLPILYVASKEYYPSPLLACASFYGSVPGHPILTDYLTSISNLNLNVELTFKEKYSLSRLKFSESKLKTIKKTLLKTYVPFHHSVMKHLLDTTHNNMVFPPTFFNPIDTWFKLRFLVGQFWWERFLYTLQRGKPKFRSFTKLVPNTVAVHHSKATWM